jgi:hypothetical protein
MLQNASFVRFGAIWPGASRLALGVKYTTRVERSDPVGQFSETERDMKSLFDTRNAPHFTSSAVAA